MTNINDFRRCLQFVLQWEGGYVNDPDDPGGETKWGISKKSYPDLDIKNLTPMQALEIYSRDYWDALDCDSYSLPNAIVIFDSGVNVGVQRVRAWIDATRTTNTSLMLHDELLQFRAQHYANLAKQPLYKKYYRGWMNRLNALRKEVDLIKEEE